MCACGCSLAASRCLISYFLWVFIEFIGKREWLPNKIFRNPTHGIIVYLYFLQLLLRRIHLIFFLSHDYINSNIFISTSQRLIWTALKSTGARPAGNSKVPPKPPKSPNTDEYKDRVNTLLLVSTLVATVTFAAGFTMPGGYNSSDPSAGMAIFLMRNMFHMFVICNTISMYTSILAAIILIWAQLGDLNLMDTAFRWALPLLGLALYAMSLGFMAGVSLVVSNLHWLAIVVFIIGIICLVSLSVPFLLLFLPSKSTNRILRYISYYPFLILVWASESPEIKQEDQLALLMMYASSIFSYFCCFFQHYLNDLVDKACYE